MEHPPCMRTCLGIRLIGLMVEGQKWGAGILRTLGGERHRCKAPKLGTDHRNLCTSRGGGRWDWRQRIGVAQDGRTGSGPFYAWPQDGHKTPWRGRGARLYSANPGSVATYPRIPGSLPFCYGTALDWAADCLCFHSTAANQMYHTVAFSVEAPTAWKHGSNATAND